MTLHESSPAGDRIVSHRLKSECKQYIGSQYWRETPAGTERDGYRSENLEAMSFEADSIDLHCHLDVLEHVNHPESCFAEMERTLRPGGAMIFTTPVYMDRGVSERVAYYDDEGVCHFIGEPEYHGNPIDADGAPVVFHYGRDLGHLITLWTTNCRVQQITPHAPDLGIVGDFCDVFLVEKGTAEG